MPRKTAAADELLTLEEVGRMLHCSAKSVRRMYNAGRLPGVRLPTANGGPGPLRFRSSDVRDALPGLTAPIAAPPPSR